jgi:hypothetical protein
LDQNAFTPIECKQNGIVFYFLDLTADIQWRKIKFSSIQKPDISLNQTRLKIHLSNGYRKDFRRVTYIPNHSRSQKRASVVISLQYQQF